MVRLYSENVFVFCKYLFAWVQLTLPFTQLTLQCFIAFTKFGCFVLQQCLSLLILQLLQFANKLFRYCKFRLFFRFISLILQLTGLFLRLLPAILPIVLHAWYQTVAVPVCSASSLAPGTVNIQIGICI